MVWPRASAKMNISPWAAEKISLIRYSARESPIVFFSGLLAAIVVVPTLWTLAQDIKKNPYGTGHQKILYTISRPQDYPKDLHPYCRDETNRN